MKKTFLIPVLLSLIVFASCNKNIQEMQAPSKVDAFLNELKTEPIFLEYLNFVNATMEIFKNNISKMNPADSTVLRNMSVTYDEKVKQLGFSHQEAVDANAKKSESLFKVLVAKYPTFNTLSADESKLFYRKAYAHYFNFKTK